MAQHHLLSPLARSLKDDEFNLLINNNEPLGYALFMYFRWGSLTEQTCPRCGVIKAHITRPGHKQWRCRDCGHDFSLKSGGLFDNTKLPYWKIIKGLYLFVTNSKGRSAIEISHKLNIGYQAAYLLLHKIRWSFWEALPCTKMTGEFDIDVVWVLKGLRDYNDRSPEAKARRQTKRREKMVARLKAEGVEEEKAIKLANKEYPLGSEPRRSNPKKQCVLGISRRDPSGTGADFHIGIPLPSENYELIRDVLHRYIEKGSVIYTDSAGASVALAADYAVRRVNHDTHYKSPDGYHTNYVESLFSRWRRMEVGTYHRMNPGTLHLFFAECTWRENNRRLSPIEKLRAALSTAARTKLCVKFKKYGRSASPATREELSLENAGRKIQHRLIRKVTKTDLTKISKLLKLTDHFAAALKAAA